MSFIASKLNLRLFIDGLEVPVIGARCSFAEGAPASAEVQVIATDQVYSLRPRAFITLYYYENYDYDVGEQAAELRRYSPQDPRRWKLLYMGELAGVQFQKQGSTRQAILVCLDHTNYWDFIKQHYVNFNEGGVALFEQAFLGINADESQLFDVTTKDATSQLFVWLNASKIRTDEGEYANIYLGVQRVLREMFFHSNHFYAQAFNRLRIGDCIVGLPQDETAAKLFKLNFFEKFIKNQISSSGGMVSLRQLIGFLLGTVFHNYVTIPCPRLDPSGALRGFTPEGSLSQDQELTSVMIPRSAHANAALHYTIIKPDTAFLVPPTCNVIFPHQYNSLSYQRQFFSEPTRLFLRTSLLFTGQDNWLTERIYAPDFDAFNVLINRPGGYLRRLAETLLPHERHVGLNPSFTWQSDLGAYVQEGHRRDYLAKLADYLFWKERFATRAVNVSGPFNPNLVPGYPGVVLDRTGADVTFTRHFVGQIRSVVHSIDQNGGWTHVTMTNARVHDETIDFDAKGRSLEEITSRGTDGFLDDRYDKERIGEEVYRPLFGVGSIVDEEITAAAAIEDVEGVAGSVAEAVNALQALYSRAVRNKNDINAFTQALTQRPKATLVDILGIPVDSSGDVPAAFQTAANETAETEGFLSTAVDPDSVDIQDSNTSFTAIEFSTVYVPVEAPEETLEQESFDGVTPTTVTVTLTPSTDTPTMTPVTTPKETEGSYDLRSLLLEKQERVQSYIDSLSDRGIRG